MSRYLIFFIAVIEGSVVMALELAAAKFVVPFFGNSLYIWSIIIGMTLFSLAVGYFFGGFIADSQRSGRFFRFVFIFNSFYILLYSFLGYRIISFLLPGDYRAGAFITICLILFPCHFTLGAIPPLLIKKITSQYNLSGRAAGKVFSISTISGVVAAFLIGFVILPEFKIADVFAGIAVFIAIPAFFLYLKHRKSVAFAFLAAFAVFFTVTSLFKEEIRPDANIIFRQEGIMGQLLVRDFPENRTLYINGLSQTVINKKTKEPVHAYVYRIKNMAARYPAGSEVLLLGVGGGSLAKEMLDHEFKVDAVEIDKRIINTAEKYFGLKPDKINLTIDDARHYLRLNSHKRYDIIIIDIAVDEAAPSYLLTVETMETVKKMLNPFGTLFSYYAGPIRYKKENDVLGYYNTLKKAGLEVKFVEINDKKNSQILVSAKDQLVINNYEVYDKVALFSPDTDRMKEEGIDLYYTDDKPLLDNLALHKLERNNPRHSFWKTIY